jgi:hypothetical protein
LSAQRLVLLAGWLAFASCTHVEDARPPVGLSVSGSGGSGQSEAGASGEAGEGGDGSGGDGISFSGAPATEELGLWPTFASREGDDADADAVLAAASALSAGSRTLPLYVKWNDLAATNGSSLTPALLRLDALIEPYRDQGKRVALCLGIVDRAEPAWPFAVPLADADAGSAVDVTIDELLARYGDVLSHLCFGYEVDRYLEHASASDAKLVSELLHHAVAHAQEAALPGTAIGVAVTLEAVATSAAVLDGLPRGDEIVAVYDPLLSDGSLREPNDVKDQLGAALDQLANEEARLPLALFEAGYPAVTEQAQRAFFEALFATLDARTRELSFIGLFGLGDRATAICDAEALSYGPASPELRSARSLARCSIGLRASPTPGATPRPRLAWPMAVSALSRYR